MIVVSGYGDADRQAEDKSADLALLRVYGAPDLVPAAFSGDAAKGPDLTLARHRRPAEPGRRQRDLDHGGEGSGARRVEPAPQLGFSGAAALDGQGRLVGMVELKTPVVASAGAASAQPQATLVPAPTIRAFLDGAKACARRPGRAGVDAAKASLVRVICVRK